MRNLSPSRQHTKGFALIVVLAALLVLAALFAASAARVQRHLAATAGEAALLDRLSTARTALELAMSWKAQQPDIDARRFDWATPSGAMTVELQDVGGLIDLNTASPELIELLFKHLDLGPDNLARYRAFRRGAKRFVRIEDFIRIVGADPDIFTTLQSLTTIFSGRTGIAPEVAPPQVLALFDDGQLADVIPERFQSPPSGANFQVRLSTGTQPAKIAGVIFVPPEGAQQAVLELF